MQQQPRTIGVAVDLSPGSKYCLSWTLEHIARAGDQVIVIIVQKKDAEVNLFEQSGSPMIPLHDYDEKVLEKYGLQEPELIAMVRQARETKQISVAAKIYYGEPREKIVEAADDVKLQMLTMGCRGLGAWGGCRALLGSVSNYVLNNVSCPVTVVKMPEIKT